MQGNTRNRTPPARVTPFPKPSRRVSPNGKATSSSQQNLAEVARAEHLPEEVDAEAAAELDEEAVHLAEVGGVAVGVEQRGGGPRVAHVHPHDLVPAAGPEAHHLRALLVLGGRDGGGRGGAPSAGAVPPPAAREGP
jgi:hypothetical protein|uniref:Uncharacterized protein n=1 Tax=Zea mays TaxID=4577 RepID=A0A804NEY3_MAIZE